MPSVLHKAIIDLIQDTPALAVRLAQPALPGLHPDARAELKPTELAQRPSRWSLKLRSGEKRAESSAENSAESSAGSSAGSARASASAGRPALGPCPCPPRSRMP